MYLSLFCFLSSDDIENHPPPLAGFTFQRLTSSPSGLFSGRTDPYYDQGIFIFALFNICDPYRKIPVSRSY